MALLNKRGLGRLLIVLGVILGGWSARKEKAAAWQPFFVMTVERVTNPRGGKLKRHYRMKTVSGIVLEAENAELFDHATLLKQKPPIETEVLAESAGPGETLTIQGMKLKDGTVILDEAQNRSWEAFRHYGILAIAALLVLLGLGIQFRRA